MASGLSSSITVTVGNGGNYDGHGSGYDSSFGSHCSATGGEGRGGHLGGIGQNGDINLKGGEGAAHASVGNAEVGFWIGGNGGSVPLFGVMNASKSSVSDFTVFGKGGKYDTVDNTEYGKGVVIIEEYI